MVGATAPCSIFFCLSDNFKKSPLNIRLLWFTRIIPHYAGMHEYIENSKEGNITQDIEKIYSKIEKDYINKEKNGKSMEIFREV